MRKGQTAVEYLMTYGWAILIILIVAGVLAYYGIFSPAGFLGPSAQGFSLVSVLSPWDFDSNGELLFQLENKLDKEITITNIYADKQTPMGNVVDIDDVTVEPKSRSDFISVSFPELSGTTRETYSINVAIEYYLSGCPIMTSNSTGTINGVRSFGFFKEGMETTCETLEKNLGIMCEKMSHNRCICESGNTVQIEDKLYIEQKIYDLIE